jgi:threonine dehydratase
MQAEDWEFDEADRERLLTTVAGDPLSGYCPSDRQALLAQEKAAGRLGVLCLAGLDGVITDTLRAQQRVAGMVVRTPLVEANHLLPQTEVRFLLKLEGMQPIGSYKLRGAANTILARGLQGSGCEVVAMTAGNHGTALAWVCSRVGLRSRLFMPENVAEVKRAAIIHEGAEVELIGENVTESAEACDRYVVGTSDAVLVPPYDDPDVITGQGTMAAEIAQELTGDEAPDYIFVPFGGGGAAAGIARFNKSLRPETRIIAVEPAGSAAMHESRRAGYRVILDTVQTVADGVAVKQVGKLNYEISEECVDECLVVSELELKQAIVDHDEAGLRAEGAGALALAGMRKYLREHPDMRGTAVGILSGNRIDEARLQQIRDELAVSLHTPYMRR